MALTNAQYDEIMRSYEKRQLANRHAADKRRQTAYAKLPRLQEIDRMVASCSVRRARLLLDGDPGACADLKGELAALGREREQLLISSGYPKDYLDISYTCPDCRDSGYIDGKNVTAFGRPLSTLSMRNPIFRKYLPGRISAPSPSSIIRIRM